MRIFSPENYNLFKISSVLFSIAEVMRSAGFVGTYIPDHIKAIYSTGLIFNVRNRLKSLYFLKANSAP